MGIIDRTLEFREILAEVSEKHAASGGAAQAEPCQSRVQSEVNAWSADIGTGIHGVSLQVQELRKMARQKGIFDDRTAHIEQLICSIRASLQMLDQKMGVFQQRVSNQSTNRTYEVHTKNLATTLNSRLGEVTKDFREALEWRTSALEQQDKRRQIYLPNKCSSANPFERARASCSESLEGGSASAGMAMQQVYQSSRAEAVQNVQATIGEVATMFHKIAGLVAAQDEVVQNIHDDVGSTLTNMEDGQRHLLDYSTAISSNRPLIIKVFLILLFFVIFFVVFLS